MPKSQLVSWARISTQIFTLVFLVLSHSYLGVSRSCHGPLGPLFWRHCVLRWAKKGREQSGVEEFFLISLHSGPHAVFIIHIFLFFPFHPSEFSSITFPSKQLQTKVFMDTTGLTYLYFNSENTMLNLHGNRALAVSRWGDLVGGALRNPSKWTVHALSTQRWN